MTPSAPPCPTPTRVLGRIALGIAVAALVGLSARRGAAQQEPARQVTLFGIVATPGASVVDPKLAKIAPQLRKLWPGHGFRMLGVESKRLAAGETMACVLGDGFVAEAEMRDASDPNGKIRLKVGLVLDGTPQVESDVTTPPNQLFFCDRKFPDGSRLVLGIGAR